MPGTAPGRRSVRYAGQTQRIQVTLGEGRVPPRVDLALQRDRVGRKGLHQPPRATNFVALDAALRADQVGFRSAFSLRTEDADAIRGTSIDAPERRSGPIGQTLQVALKALMRRVESS